MAQAETVRGTKLLVKIEDPLAPGTYTHNCSINGQRSVQFSSQTNDTNVPDCDDPDLMAWVEREKVSLSATIQGAGTLHTPDVTLFYRYMADSDPWNVRFVIDVPGASGGVYFHGAFLCTDWQAGGDRGAKSDGSVTLQSSGVVGYTPNP